MEQQLYEHLQRQKDKEQRRGKDKEQRGKKDSTDEEEVWQELCDVTTTPENT